MLIRFTTYARSLNGYMGRMGFMIIAMAAASRPAYAFVRALLPIVTGPSHAPIYTLSSPNHQITVRIEMPKAESQSLPRSSASIHGKPALVDCRLSLVVGEVTGGSQGINSGIALTIVNPADAMMGARVRDSAATIVNEPVRILFGKAAAARDQYRELRLSLSSGSGYRVDVVFRCYDDAVALRYEVPKQGGIERLAVVDEGTSFSVAGNPDALVQYLESFRTSHEHNVSRVPWRSIAKNRLLDMPLTIVRRDGVHIAITEAGLRGYAGMSLIRPDRQGSESDGLVCALSPRPDGVKVVRELPLASPWRVALLSNRAGGLLESNTLYCLNPPPVIGDTSWIHPGKITFNWWNGNVYDGKPGEPVLSLAMNKKYIDFCAKNGIAYHSVIADESVTPWYHQSNPGVVPGPDTDVTKVRDDLDLAGIRKYAESHGVMLWTWVHNRALKGRVEEAFAAFEKMGWKGMMVDFFDRDDQETVEYAEQILQAAARHHILIHLHGIWKANGVQRIYPNLMNHEGALNLEYLKWSDRCTPRHNLNMVFTRLIGGPMDYHLGGFRAVRRDQFKPKNVAPNVLGTRCHHLAMYVCFDNPTPMVADYPTAYEGQPGFEFIGSVPTYWDETRVLAAEAGRYIVTARRRGAAWYIGAMSAEKELNIPIRLSFLRPGRHTMESWEDNTATVQDPNRLSKQMKRVDSATTFRLHTAVDGGFVARLLPMAR